MFAQRFISVLMLLSLLLLPARVRAECDPYGVCTLRGDVQSLLAGIGVIEISPPDEFVYGIVDGAAPDPQFSQLKARLRNRITDRAMGSGTVAALARYRLRTNYQNDLSTDPPAKEDVEKNVTFSISQAVDVLSIPSDTTLQLVFDFSADPIPAGITDLFILVVFFGQIEGIEEPITAIGFKDLNEPHHVARWNNTDWFLIDSQWLTGADIRAKPSLMEFVDENCWHMEPYIDPMDIELYVGFSAEEQDSPVYTVHYQNIPAGRFGRLIFLSDAEQIWMHARSITHSPNDTLDWKGKMPGVTNQMDPKGFTSTTPYTRRGIVAHSSVGWSWTCPTVSSISSELYDEMSSKPAASTEPVAITTITFP
jgi:hypothetical protein